MLGCSVGHLNRQRVLNVRRRDLTSDQEGDED